MCLFLFPYGIYCDIIIKYLVKDHNGVTSYLFKVLHL